MDDYEVSDHLDEIDMSGSRTKAEDFEALADSMPVGEHGRATFLTAAGQHRQMRKEYDEARRLRQLVRDDRLGADSCHFVGDTLWDHGRLREALRWFTIPLTYADVEEDDIDRIAAAEIEYRSSTH